MGVGGRGGVGCTQAVPYNGSFTVAFESLGNSIYRYCVTLITECYPVISRIQMLRVILEKSAYFIMKMCVVCSH